jgi:hypothetical protein
MIVERETARNAAGAPIQDLVAGPPRKGRDGDHRVTRINGVDACGVTLYECSPRDAISAPLVSQRAGLFVRIEISAFGHRTATAILLCPPDRRDRFIRHEKGGQYGRLFVVYHPRP